MKRHACYTHSYTNTVLVHIGISNAEAVFHNDWFISILIFYYVPSRLAIVTGNNFGTAACQSVITRKMLRQPPWQTDLHKGNYGGVYKIDNFSSAEHIAKARLSIVDGGGGIATGWISLAC